MAFYQLAVKYLSRKRSKTVLLFLVLLFVSSMILSTNMILQATEDSKASIQEKTNAKVVLDILDENSKITTEDIKQIQSLRNVSSLNRLSMGTAFLSESRPVTNSDSVKEDNLKVSLLSYDDLKNDSAFFEERYRLSAGQYLTKETKGSIVVNSLLAEYNGLKIGDEISFESSDGKTVSAEIIGLFLSGSEVKQTDTIAAVNRIENQIFMDHHTFSMLVENDGFYKVAVYTKSPKELEKLETELERIVGDKTELTTSDLLYKQMEAPLEQIRRVTKLMLTLALVTGTIVVSLLLCMWMRTRKKETAVFISMGYSKISIFLQVFLEAMLVFIMAVCGACAVGSAMSNRMQTMLMGSGTSDIHLNVVLKWSDIASLLYMGGFVVLAAVVCSLIPILKANPKDTFSKMEG